jgi:hypothetical protein
LNRLLSFFSEVSFEFDEECFYRYRCHTKKEVLEGYCDIANQAFREYNIGLLFVVIDHDDDVREHSDYHKELSEAVIAQLKDKVIITIPVRSIEHWLRYLQWKKENPQSTKNEFMENERRGDSKTKVYGSKKPSNHRVAVVVDDLLNPHHISWLCQRSASFNHLYIQLQKIK